MNWLRLRRKAAEVAGKGTSRIAESGIDVTDSIHSVEDLLNLSELRPRCRKGAFHREILGDPQKILQNLTGGAEKMDIGPYKLNDGTVVTYYLSTTDKTDTFFINQNGKITKVRVIRK